MRLVFCGTPQFAVPTLQALVAAGHDVALAISQPDRPVGRSAQVTATPVKAAAQAHGIPVTQPEKLRTNPDLEATLRDIAPDAIIVVAYGRILPQWMLDLPRHGCLNGHASLLPRWRGAAPIQWAVAAGDTETGVTTMRLDTGLDTGGMLLRRSVPITSTTTSPDLFTLLADIAADLMVETLAGLESGTLTPQPQDDTLATLAPILRREDGEIDWLRPAAEVDCRFRGFQPWPGAFTALRGKKLIVHRMRVATHVTGDAGGLPGHLVGPVPPGTEGMLVACGDGRCVLLEEVQSEGRKRMPAADFLRGHQVQTGERLG